MQVKLVLSAATLLLCPVSLLPAQTATSAPPATTALTVSPETRAAVRELVGDTIVDGQAYEYDEHLADMIGPRLTGSANYMKAAAWAEEQFKALGLSNVHTEEWTIPATWEPDGPAVGKIMSPVEHNLHIYSLGWSPSTPEGGVEGQVHYIHSLATADLDREKDKIAGGIALIDHESFGPNPDFVQLLQGLEHLQEIGPKAILVVGGPKGTENMFSLSLDAKIAPIPEAQIGLEDTLLIKRLLEQGPVSVSFSFRNLTRTDVKIPNVIAEIPGSEDPKSVVIVGAHLDSWQPGTGAQDNGTGVATVLETARAMMALHRPPRRTVRFILFGGEEEGLLGSVAYVRAHLAELPDIDAVLISDTGAEPAKGWYLMGREDEKNPLAGIKPLLTGLGGDGIDSDTRFLFQTDHIGFDVLGVPSLVLWTETDKYETLHHKASDTFDSVVQKDLNQGVAVVAATAYAIADSKDSFAPHLNADQVAAMLKASGHLDDYKALKKDGALP